MNDVKRFKINDETTKFTLRRRKIDNNNKDQEENITKDNKIHKNIKNIDSLKEIGNNSEEKFTQLINGFNKQEFNSGNKFSLYVNNSEQSDKMQTTEQNNFKTNSDTNSFKYKKIPDDKTELINTRPYSFNSKFDEVPNTHKFKEDSSSLEEINKNNMKLIFQQAKIQMNTEEKHVGEAELNKKEASNNLNPINEKRYNSIINNTDIQNMTNTLTNRFSKMSKLLEDSSALKPKADHYGIIRGICEVCLEDCKGYTPSIHALNNIPSICASCNCGASNHKQIGFDDATLNTFATSIKNQILPYINHLTQCDIRFNSFMVVFSLSNQDKNNLSCNVDNLLNILKEWGFKVILSKITKFSDEERLGKYNSEKNQDYFNENDYFKENRNDKNETLFRFNNRRDDNFGITRNSGVDYLYPIYDQSSTIKFNKTDFKSLYLDLHNLTNQDFKSFSKFRRNFKETTFEKLKKINCSMNTVEANKNQTLEFKNSDSFYFFKSNKRGLDKTEKNSTNFDIVGTHLLYLCLSIENNKLPTSFSKNKSNITDYFEKFYYTIKNNMCFQNIIDKQLNLVYYSKNKIDSLWDLQTVFPEIFKINTLLSVIKERPNLNRYNHLNINFLQNEAINPNEVKNLNTHHTSSLTKFTESQNQLNQLNPNISSGKFKISQTSYLKTGNKIQIEEESKPNKRIFFKYLSQFKDFLIMNGIFFDNSNHFESFESIITHFKENVNNKLNNESEAIYINNFLNYISNQFNINNFNNSANFQDVDPGEFVFSLLKRIGGLNNFNPQGFFNNFDMINISTTLEQEILSRVFLQDEATKYSRILLVLRPMTLRSGLSECILNIFRINDFMILKRRSQILNHSEIEFLYNLEFNNVNNIKSDNETNILSFENYYKIMSDFNVDLVVLAKFGVVDDANLICGNSRIAGSSVTGSIMNSMSMGSILSFINNLNVEFEVENDLIHKDHKIKTKNYSEKIDFNFVDHTLDSVDNNINSFNGIKSLLDIKSLFSSMVKDKQKIHSNINNYESYDSLRKNLLRFLSNFNIFAYNTKSGNDSNFVHREINFFFPKFGDIQEILVLVQPNKSYVNNQIIKETLIKMDFEILDSVMYQMNEDEFGNMFDNYFVNNMITPFDYSNSKENFTREGNLTEIIRLIKPGGKYDINIIIGNDNYHMLTTYKNLAGKENDYANYNSINSLTFSDKIKMIKDNCFLLKTSNENEYFYPLVNNKVSIIEGQYLLKHAEDAEKQEILTLGEMNHLNNLINSENTNISYDKTSNLGSSYFKKISQSQVIHKNSMLIIHVLNSCLKCTIGDSIRYDLNSSVSRDKLIDRYLKFYHYDDSNKIIKDLNIFSKWNAKSEFNEKHFEFLHFSQDCINTQISFFVESDKMGFYEVRIPILENDLFDLIQLNIAKSFLYCDPEFYDELEDKFKNKDLPEKGYIVVEKIPFYDMGNQESNDNPVKELNNQKNSTTSLKFNEKNFNQYEKNDEDWIQANLIQLNQSVREAIETSMWNNSIKQNKIKDDEESFSNKNPEFSILNKLKENIHIIKKRIFYRTKFEMCKYFYKTCSTLTNNYSSKTVSKKINSIKSITPSTYHFRIKPDDIVSDIRRIYEVEEFAGLNFIEIVAQDLLKYRPQEITKESKNSIYNEYSGYSSMKIQSSLPAYLWGRKLAEVCKILQRKAKINMENPEIIDIIEIPNAGPIIYSIKEQILKGIINPKYMLEYNQYLYINIIEDIKSSQNDVSPRASFLEFKIFNDSQMNIVEEKLHKILISEIFIRSRSEETLTISPVRLIESNIRIHKQIESIENLNEIGNFENVNKNGIDREIKFHEYFKIREENDLNKEISSKSVKLIDIFCHKSSKYHSYAAFRYLINITYKKLNRKSHLVNNDELEYDRMIEALLKGFESVIDYDMAEVNDGSKLNAYKVEYFLYCLAEIKYMMNELTEYKKILRNLQNSLRIFRLNSRNNNEVREKEYSKHISHLKKNIHELNINMEIVFAELVAYDVFHQITQKEDKKIIVLPKERYHIPMHFPEYWERDFENPKFKDVKNTKESYVMDMNKVNYMKRIKDLSGTGNKSMFYDCVENPLILSENKLREYKKENNKEIIFEKKKDENRRHPIKLFAELVRKQNND